MGDLVSLKLHRKRKARAGDEQRAADNRVQFGRTKQEKQLTKALNEKAGKDLDALKRED